MLIIENYSEGRHYQGYKEGDDEGDKYFWPETGSHFEYIEVIRKLHRFKKKHTKHLSEEPTSKPQLVIKEELTKNMLDHDTQFNTEKAKQQCKPISITFRYFTKTLSFRLHAEQHWVNSKLNKLLKRLRSKNDRELWQHHVSEQQAAE